MAVSPNGASAVLSDIANAATFEALEAIGKHIDLNAYEIGERQAIAAAISDRAMAFDTWPLGGALPSCGA